MREFVVSEAPLDRVAALAQATVEDLGGVVAHHTPRTTAFDNLLDDEGDWSRSGYVGTYQRFREDPVRLRIRVWASWPRKLFFWSIWLGLIEALVFFSMSIVGTPPPPNVWILTAILTFALIGTGLLMYSTSWADSADLEDRIARELTGRLRDDEAIEGDVYTIGGWTEHREDVIEAAVEAAEERAPERPSRAKQALSSLTTGSEGQGAASQVLQRFRSGEEGERDEEEADEPDEEEDQASSPEDEPDRSLVDRLTFWRGDEPPEDEPEDDELTAKRARLEELKRQREAGQAKEEPDPADDAEGTDETEAKAEDADEDPGLVDRLAFWRSDADEEGADEPDGDVAPDETEDEPEAGDSDEGPGLVDRLAFWRGGDEDGTSPPNEEAPDASGAEAPGGEDEPSPEDPTDAEEGSGETPEASDEDAAEDPSDEDDRSAT